MQVSQQKAAAAAAAVGPSAANVASDIRYVHQPQNRRTPITTSWTTTIKSIPTHADSTMRSPAQIANQTCSQPKPFGAGAAVALGGIKSSQRDCVCGGGIGGGEWWQWQRWGWYCRRRFASASLQCDEARPIQTEAYGGVGVGGCGDGGGGVRTDDDKMAWRSPVHAVVDGSPDRTNICCCCPTTTTVGRVLRWVGAHLNEHHFSRSTIQFLGAMCQQGTFGMRV